MEDEVLIDLYFSRSEDAIVQTKEKYNSFCYSIAYNILRNHEEAEECVNDTYFRLWNVIPPNRPLRMTAFIGRIVKNLSLNKLKMSRTKGRGAGEMNIQLSELAECVDMSTNVESENERLELSGSVTEFIKGQKQDKQRIFIQRYWYMMDIKDIAKNNSISESKVKMTLLRMRNDLKTFLEEKGLY